MQKSRYKKERYIRERQNKHGLSFQISVPYPCDSGTAYITETVKAWTFPSDRDAFAYAKRRRDLILANLPDSKEKTVPTVVQFFERMNAITGASLRTVAFRESLFRTSMNDYADVPLDKIKPADIQCCPSPKSRCTLLRLAVTRRTCVTTVNKCI